ncbi:MAG: hypothetical protein LUD72_07505 [Bacteroidales bacterium]|nr:hypothetical protein [Bacteroidales bacterium]
MLISIELRDRLHKELEAYCKRENLSLAEFCAQLVEDAYYTAKYGDLNEIMGVDKSAKVIEQPEPEPQKEEPAPIVAQPTEEPKQEQQEEMKEKSATTTKPKRTRRKLL